MDISTRPIHRLASGHDVMVSHYDAIAVGSGYGGAIAASRLARARRPDGTSLSVCLLERGAELQHGRLCHGEGGHEGDGRCRRVLRIEGRTHAVPSAPSPRDAEGDMRPPPAGPSLTPGGGPSSRAVTPDAGSRTPVRRAHRPPGPAVERSSLGLRTMGTSDAAGGATCPKLALFFSRGWWVVPAAQKVAPRA
jgi:choline dehydrogenase-like flavoprotein